jgi:photosystem II stability/assembly factor-like uncharacterized protein
MHKFLLASLFVVLSATLLHAQPLQWTEEGTPFGALSIAVNGTTIFAGTHYQGIFRSLDNGINWKHLYTSTINEPITDVNSLAIDGMIIFAGTNQGLYISSDNGDTWLPSAVMAGQQILFTFVNGSTVFAGGDGGIYRSTNEGNSWKALKQSGSCMAVNGSTLYLGADYNPGFFHSTDNGDSWIAAKWYPASTDWTTYSIAVLRNAIFAAVRIGNYPSGNTFEVYRSMDSSKTWNALGQNSQINCLAVIGDTLFAGSEAGLVTRSTDLGNTWTVPIGDVCYDLAVAGSTLYAASGLAVYHTTDGGNTWIRSGNGWTYNTLGSGSTYYITNVIVGINGTYVFVCLNDTSGSVYRSSNNGMTWMRASSGLPNTEFNKIQFTAVSCSGNNCYLGTDQGVYRSTNNGDSWFVSSEGLPPSTAPTRPTIYGFTTAGNYVFAATDDGVYRSSDDGSSWLLTHYWRQPPAYCLLTNNATVFAGTYWGVYRTTDFGDSWVHLDTILPEIKIDAMAINGNTLFAGDSRSTDGGNTWVPYTNFFWGFNSLTVSGGILYGGTGEGVFLSSDNGDTWVQENDGLPSSPSSPPNVTSLVIARNVAFAGTPAGLYYADLTGSLSVNPVPIGPSFSIQVFPNPLTSSATMHYSLTQEAEITISIFDLLGREVMKPISGELQAAGEHEALTDMRHLAPGIYECRLNAGGYIRSTKIVLVK